jgi:hypothetical protein
LGRELLSRVERSDGGRDRIGLRDRDQVEVSA